MRRPKIDRALSLDLGAGRLRAADHTLPQALAEQAERLRIQIQSRQFGRTASVTARINALIEARQVKEEAEAAAARLGVSLKHRATGGMSHQILAGSRQFGKQHAQLVDATRRLQQGMAITAMGTPAFIRPLVQAWARQEEEINRRMAIAGLHADFDQQQVFRWLMQENDLAMPHPILDLVRQDKPFRLTATQAELYSGLMATLAEPGQYVLRLPGHSSPLREPELTRLKPTVRRPPWPFLQRPIWHSRFWPEAEVRFTPEQEAWYERLKQEGEAERFRAEYPEEPCWPFDSDPKNT